MEKFNEKQIAVLKRHFRVFEDDEIIELETYTDGGVDMIITINKAKDNLQQLVDYCEKFDLDEEIDLYRQNEDYKKHFTILQSVQDFSIYIDTIKYIVAVLKALEE